jgi:hypothetical protein
MKAKYFAALGILFVAAGSAFADNEYPEPAAGFHSVKSRADVAVELNEAKAEGIASPRDDNYPVDVHVHVAPRTRTEVRAEEIQWAKSHPHRQAGINDLYFG